MPDLRQRAATGTGIRQQSGQRRPECVPFAAHDVHGGVEPGRELTQEPVDLGAVRGVERPAADENLRSCGAGQARARRGYRVPEHAAGLPRTVWGAGHRLQQCAHYLRARSVAVYQVVGNEPINLQPFRGDGDHRRAAIERPLHPQPDDRILLGDIAPHKDDHIGVIHVRKRGCHSPRREQAGASRRRVGAVIQVIRANHAAEEPPGHVGVLVGQARPAEHRHPARSGGTQPARHDVQRFVPRGFAQPAPAADQRGAQAILVVHVGVTEKSEVAQPDVVHGRGFARAGAGDGAVAHIELQGAADAAQRAHAGHRLIVPWPGGEPIRLGRQRAHGADGDGVADKLRLHRQSERRVYLAVESPLKPFQRVVAGDQLAEPHAPPAQDAPLPIEHQHTAQGDRLGEVAFGLDEAAAAGAVLIGLVLQRAFAALVADGTVQRMIDEQELQDGFLSGFDFGGGREDGHAICRLQGAGGLEFRHFFDLDQTHPARPQRGHAVVVAEDGDLDAGPPGGVVDGRPLRDGDRPPVDGQRDRWWKLAH